MALTKVTYTDGETVVHAQNLNDIQDEIISTESNLTKKQDALTAGSNITISNNTISASIPTTTVSGETLVFTK